MSHEAMYGVHKLSPMEAHRVLLKFAQTGVLVQDVIRDVDFKELISFVPQVESLDPVTQWRQLELALVIFHLGASGRSTEIRGVFEKGTDRLIFLATCTPSGRLCGIGTKYGDDLLTARQKYRLAVTLMEELVVAPLRDKKVDSVLCVVGNDNKPTLNLWEVMGQGLLKRLGCKQERCSSRFMEGFTDIHITKISTNTER